MCDWCQKSSSQADPLCDSLAAEYGLDVVYYSKFEDIFYEEKENPDFARLMSTMHVINEFGESDMDEEMWEAASMSG